MSIISTPPRASSAVALCSICTHLCFGLSFRCRLTTPWFQACSVEQVSALRRVTEDFGFELHSLRALITTRSSRPTSLNLTTVTIRFFLLSFDSFAGGQCAHLRGITSRAFRNRRSPAPRNNRYRDKTRTLKSVRRVSGCQLKFAASLAYL